MHWQPLLNIVCYVGILLVGYTLGRRSSKAANKWCCPHCNLVIASNHWGASQIMRAEHLQTEHRHLQPHIARKTRP